MSVCRTPGPKSPPCEVYISISPLSIGFFLGGGGRLHHTMSTCLHRGEFLEFWQEIRPERSDILYHVADREQCCKESRNAILALRQMYQNWP